MRIVIPRAESIIDPTIKSLVKLAQRARDGEQLPNLRISFHGMGGRFKLTSALARSMRGLPITDLDLGWNSVIPRALAELAGLGLPIRSFELMGSGLTPKVAAAVATLPLTKMRLSSCAFASRHAASLNGLSLETLVLRECWKVSKGTFRELADMPISSLTLHHFPRDAGANRRLTVKLFGELAGLSRLTHLNLWGSYLTLEMLNELRGSSITRLGLGQCQLTVDMIHGLAQMPIVDLDLSGCRLTIEMVQALEALKKLRHLDLSNCTFSQPMVDLLARQFPTAERIASYPSDSRGA